MFETGVIRANGADEWNEGEQSGEKELFPVKLRVGITKELKHCKEQMVGSETEDVTNGTKTRYWISNQQLGDHERALKNAR